MKETKTEIMFMTGKWSAKDIHRGRYHHHGFLGLYGVKDIEDAHAEAKGQKVNGIVPKAFLNVLEG